MFVVVGDVAVGLGHVYRSTQLAHELLDHEVLFVSPPGNDLAVDQLTLHGFSVHVPSEPDLARAVLQLKPDLVVNDVLNTDREYVLSLKNGGARVVNFEDLGPGAEVADVVVNDIFMEDDSPN